MVISISMPYDMDCSRFITPRAFLLLVIFGQDDFTIREKLNQIKSEVFTEGLGEADVSLFDGKSV